MGALENEVDDLHSQLADGLITVSEFNRRLREIEAELREEPGER